MDLSVSSSTSPISVCGAGRCVVGRTEGEEGSARAAVGGEGRGEGAREDERHSTRTAQKRVYAYNVVPPDDVQAQLHFLDTFVQRVDALRAMREDDVGSLVKALELALCVRAS